MSMNSMTLRSVGIILVAAGTVGRGPEALAQAPNQAGTLDAVLVEIGAAQTELVQGRAEAFKAFWSHGEDVTLVGGLGGEIAKGWDAVSDRLDWVSTQYSAGSRTHEEVSRLVREDMAYVVQRETIRFRVPGEAREVTQLLRATIVLRREGNTWRIVHRHADSQTVRESTR